MFGHSEGLQIFSLNKLHVHAYVAQMCFPIDYVCK